MAGACASTFRSAPSGIPTLCAVWQSARRMCCSWRRTYCVDKSCYINMIDQAMQVSEARRWSESHFSLPGVKGIGGGSEEHTSELQSQAKLVCRLLLEKKKKKRVDCDCDRP